MAVNLYESHRPREATITVSQGDPTQNQDYSGDIPCSGAADDVEIQAALAYVAALGGGKVILLDGVYSLSAALVDNGVNGITLSGMGESTVLRIANGADCNAIELTTVSGWILEDFKVDGNADQQTVNQQLVYLHTCTDCRVQRLWVTDANDVDPADAANIYLFDPEYCVVSECTVWDSEYYGVRIETTASTTVTDTSLHHNKVYGCTGVGLSSGISTRVLITDNICTLNDFGISINGFYHIVGNNICSQNIHSNINAAGEQQVIVGNVCVAAANNYGIWVQASDSLIANNMIRGSAGDGVTVTAAASGSIVIGNNINTNGGYGVDIEGGTASTVAFNKYYGNTLGPIRDNGIRTGLESTQIWFVGDQANLLSAAGAPKGYEIDAATEYALGFAAMPIHAYRSVRIRIFGTSLAAAPGAGNGMMLNIVIEVGVSGENYAAEAIAVTKACEEDNPAQNSRITWALTVADDVDVDDLTGDDRIEVRVLHNVAVGGDVATDVAITGGEIQFV